MNEFPTESKGLSSASSVIITAVVTALIVAGAMYWLYNPQVEQLQSQIQQHQQTITKLRKNNPPPSQRLNAPDKAMAAIEGSLSYPSEFIPEDMKICAEDISTQQLYCTSQHIRDSKFTNGLGYRLLVPPGSYKVYAATAVLPNYKAYYSEFVTCGLQASCSSHEAIGIKLSAGQTMTGVDPADWYK